MQKKISDWSDRSLTLTLEKVFEKIKVPGNVLIIDKMELDIVIDEQGNWLDHLSKEIADQLFRYLEPHENNDNVSGIIRKSIAGNFFEAFVYFLQQGYLPWWSDIKRKEDFFQQVDELIKSGFSPEMKTTLSSILRDEVIMQRTVWQVPDDLFFEMVFNLSPGIKQQAERVRKDIDKIKSHAASGEKKIIEIVFKKALLAGIGKTEEKQIVEKILEAFKESVSQSTLYHVLKKSVEEIKNRHFKEGIKDLLVLTTKSQSTQIEKTKEETQEKLTKAKSIKSEKDIRSKLRQEEIEKKVSEGIYINNAGLVIVAGFLPMIFKKLSILEGDKIKDMNKAVCLVHHLASGENSFVEYELGIAKILCGLDMETPVDTDIILSEDEKEEATELLLSVIEYWSVLKDTSVAGLRESFIMREGKLSFNNNEWLLQVEQKAYDMLLQNIPWNISMIKLPWMDHLLRTEWIF